MFSLAQKQKLALIFYQKGGDVYAAGILKPA